MGALRKSLWTIAAVAAVPLPAAAQDMCAALNRIAAAAGEPAPFASLEGHEGGLVPGYNYCRVETGTRARVGRVMCHSQMAPKTLIAETVGAQVRDCLHAAPGLPERYSQASVYRTPTLTISVESHCDEHCHVGRLASIEMRRRRADEAAPAR